MQKQQERKQRNQQLKEREEKKWQDRMKGLEEKKKAKLERQQRREAEGIERPKLNF